MRIRESDARNQMNTVGVLDFDFPEGYRGETAHINLEFLKEAIDIAREDEDISTQSYLTIAFVPESDGMMTVIHDKYQSQTGVGVAPILWPEDLG